MTDPTGTSGAPAPTTDLDLAIKGGPKFAERLDALGQATDSHEEARAAAVAALAELNLGREVKAAHAAAMEMRAEAERVIADARAKAEEITAAAEVRAHEIVAATNQQAAQLREEAETVLRAAAEDAVKVRQAAAAVLEQANRDATATRQAAVEHHDVASKQRSAADLAMAYAERMQADHATALAAAETRAAAAEAAERDLNNKIAILTEAMQRASVSV